MVDLPPFPKIERAFPAVPSRVCIAFSCNQPAAVLVKACELNAQNNRRECWFATLQQWFSNLCLRCIVGTKGMTFEKAMSPSGRRTKITLEASLRGRPIGPRTVIGLAHKASTAVCISLSKASVGLVGWAGLAGLAGLAAELAGLVGLAETVRTEQWMACRVDGPYFRTKDRAEDDSRPSSFL